jgi:hypothetical protein
MQSCGLNQGQDDQELTTGNDGAVHVVRVATFGKQEMAIL